MKFLPRTILLSSLCLGLGACATHRPAFEQAPIKAPAPAPVAIGKVALVNNETGFALIESAVSPEPGAKLQSRSLSGQETAQLQVSVEKKPPFIIADIMKGKPTVGELVTK